MGLILLEITNKLNLDKSTKMRRARSLILHADDLFLSDVSLKKCVGRHWAEVECFLAHRNASSLFLLSFHSLYPPKKKPSASLQTYNLAYKTWVR